MIFAIPNRKAKKQPRSRNKKKRHPSSGLAKFILWGPELVPILKENDLDRNPEAGFEEEGGGSI